MAAAPPSCSGATGRTIETAMLAVLSGVVFATVVAIAALLVSDASTDGPVLAADSTPTLATSDQGDEVFTTALDAPSAADAPTEGEVGFTLRELAAGEVSSERFDAFWEAELDRIRTGPCPAPTAKGTTVVRISVGATAPAHLGDRYVDYAPLLTDARAEACA